MTEIPQRWKPLKLVARIGERIVTSFGKAKTSQILISCDMVVATAARILIWWRRRRKIHRPNWSSSSCTSKRLWARCRWIWIWKWTSSAMKMTGNCLLFLSPPSKRCPRGSSGCCFRNPNLHPPPPTKTTTTQYDAVLAATTRITTTTIAATTTTTMMWWCGRQTHRFRGNRACWEWKLGWD